MGDQARGLLSPWLRSRRMKAVRDDLRGRILDYGCGVGSLARWVSPGNYVGLDIDSSSLSQARALHPEHTFVRDLAEVSGNFDTVVMLALIEHVPNPSGVVREIAELLRPDGRLIVTTPHPGARRLHEWGARVGIFSREAADEHEDLLDEDALRTVFTNGGLRLARYARFLGGVNQLAVGVPAAR